MGKRYDSARRLKRRMSFRKFIFLTVFLSVSCFFVFLIFQWTVKKIVLHIVPVLQVEKGTIEDKLDLQVYIAREEQTITAPVTGDLVTMVQEGERVPVGATIAYIIPVAVEPAQQGPVELKAPFAGQVSYQIDGLERVLRPGELGNINHEELKRLIKLARPVNSETRVRAGTAVIRLVNNLEPLKLYAVVEKWPESLQEGKQVVIVTGEAGTGNDGRIKARISRLQDEGNQRVVIMEVPLWDNSWLRPREREVSIVLDSYQGVIIPVGALTTNSNGEKGVYVLGARSIEWRQVSVTGRVGNKAAVEGIKANSEVIANPDLMRWLFMFKLLS